MGVLRQTDSERRYPVLSLGLLCVLRLVGVESLRLSSLLAKLLLLSKIHAYPLLCFLVLLYILLLLVEVVLHARVRADDALAISFTLFRLSASSPVLEASISLDTLDALELLLEVGVCP